MWGTSHTHTNERTLQMHTTPEQAIYRAGDVRSYIKKNRSGMAIYEYVRVSYTDLIHIFEILSVYLSGVVCVRVCWVLGVGWLCKLHCHSEV